MRKMRFPARGFPVAQYICQLYNFARRFGQNRKGGWDLLYDCHAEPRIGGFRQVARPCANPPRAFVKTTSSLLPRYSPPSLQTNTSSLTVSRPIWPLELVASLVERSLHSLFFPLRILTTGVLEQHTRGPRNTHPRNSTQTHIYIHNR